MEQEHLKDNLLIPPGLKAKFAKTAFAVAGPWPAWELSLAKLVVAEMKALKLALPWAISVSRSGDETMTGYRTESGDYYCEYTSDGMHVDETWSEYVDRSCAELEEILEDFEPVKPLLPTEDYVLGFEIMWAAEKDAERLCSGKHLKRTEKNIGALREEVELFKAWAAKTYPPESNPYGEWECDYEYWSDIYATADKLLMNDLAKWSAEDRQILLYAIARDNECEILVNKLSVEQLFSLAETASSDCQESDAKWQLAVRLGEYPEDPRTESLLVKFSEDSNEYVRRRSFMALGETGSTCAEAFAKKAWESGDQYQRMACLHTLFSIDSPELSKYIQLAEGDSSEYLCSMARKIRNREGEYSGAD